MELQMFHAVFITVFKNFNWQNFVQLLGLYGEKEKKNFFFFNVIKLCFFSVIISLQ